LAVEVDMRSPDAASGPPSLEAQRCQLRQRVLTSPRCWRLLVLGHSGGGGWDRFAALGRALENLGHAVPAGSPDRPWLA